MSAAEQSTEVKKFNMDTVAIAAATPDTELPWAEPGLKANEFDEVVKVLGREPLSWGVRALERSNGSAEETVEHQRAPAWPI